MNRIGRNIELMEEEVFLTSKVSVESFLSNSNLVYFLIDGNKIVYVGKTNNLMSRIKDHLKSKKFDSYQAYKCFESEEADILELEYIIKFSPKYNKVLPKNDYYASFKNLKELFNVGAWDLKKHIRENGLHPVVTLNNTNYYDISDFHNMEV